MFYFPFKRGETQTRGLRLGTRLVDLDLGYLLWFTAFRELGAACSHNDITSLPRDSGLHIAAGYRHCLHQVSLGTQMWFEKRKCHGLLNFCCFHFYFLIPCTECWALSLHPSSRLFKDVLVGGEKSGQSL